MARLLQGYDRDKADYLIKGFSEGFRIESSSTSACQAPRNSLFVERNPDIIEPFIRKEVQSGRFRGPFKDPPFTNMYVSPLGARPKKQVGKYRIIHDLSYPYDGVRAVNDGIPHEVASVQYYSVADAVDLILDAGGTAYLCKTDIEHAFRNLPIHPDDHHLLGFQFNNMYYYDTCLSMGCASSCSIFESFTTALQWIASNKCGIDRIVHMVDDFFMVGVNEKQAAMYLDVFRELCSFLGVPLSEEKTFGPSQRLPFLGIDLCVRSMTAFIPLDKRIAYAKELLGLFDSRFTTKQDMRQIVGRLNWATSVVQGGRPFIRRFIDRFVGVRSNHQKLYITDGLREDAKVWLRFLTQHNGKVMFLPRTWVESDVVNLNSDASVNAGSFMYGSKWFRIEYPKSWCKCNIAFLEFYPIVVGLDMFQHKLANHRIHFITDNMAICHVINSQTSKHHGILLLLRIFVLICIKANIHFSASYIKSKDNNVADYLSRFQPSATKLTTFGLSLWPERVPPRWLPSNFASVHRI